MYIYMLILHLSSMLFSFINALVRKLIYQVNIFKVHSSTRGDDFSSIHNSQFS